MSQYQSHPIICKYYREELFYLNIQLKKTHDQHMSMLINIRPINQTNVISKELQLLKHFKGTPNY